MKNYFDNSYENYANSTNYYWNSLLHNSQESQSSDQHIKLLNEAIESMFSELTRDNVDVGKFVKKELKSATENNDLIKIQFLVNLISYYWPDDLGDTLVSLIDRLLEWNKSQIGVYWKLTSGIIEQTTDVLSHYSTKSFTPVMRKLYEQANSNKEYDTIVEAAIKGLHCLDDSKQSYLLVKDCLQSNHAEIVDEAEYIMEDYLESGLIDNEGHWL